jgi:glycogen synthase
VSDLLAALPRLRRYYPGLRAVIAGDGPSRSQLHRQARMLKLGRAVSFTGFLDLPELAAVVAATDAMVVPSLVPSSMVALEAAAAGAPLAIASAAGMTDLVEPGVTAVTFPPGDPDGLAEAVDRLLADPSFARRLAARARDGVTAHTWDVAATRTAEVYADTVALPATGRVPAQRHSAQAR